MRRANTHVRLLIIAMILTYAPAARAASGDIKTKIEQLNEREKVLLEKLEATQQRERDLQSRLDEVRHRREFLQNQQQVHKPGQHAATPVPTFSPPPSP